VPPRLRLGRGQSAAWRRGRAPVRRTDTDALAVPPGHRAKAPRRRPGVPSLQRASQPRLVSLNGQKPVDRWSNGLHACAAISRHKHGEDTPRHRCNRPCWQFIDGRYDLAARTAGFGRARHDQNRSRRLLAPLRQGRASFSCRSTGLDGATGSASLRASGSSGS